ncbi:uncharacterized protein LOC119832423 [Zerene cesonia]|uniref:uncharacterized protein LOC119832423 n=1 Tax=Zerene cesonia TaxID=33412 RepID=UPI0018E4F238|nr:uncharacterized protein LOC119832423 [Zerene cesonia]
MSGEGERASRPNSLLLEAPAPEREPLRFDVNLVGAPPEVEQLVNNIKQVAEDFLYHWKTFPIVLPQSRFTGPGNHPSDIIIAPPCDEIDAAALDAGIEPHPLSPKQLHSIREKGEFEVPSRHFPGQTHVWRVAGWLQRGRVRAREDLYCHVARAVALIVVVARDRLVRDERLSVIAGVKALLKGLHRLLDLIIGMPWLEARDLDKKIREERSRYLVAELICKPENREDISALAAWVSRAMRRAAAEKADARDPPRAAPRVPYAYTTPQRTQVDLRLYRRELLRRAAPALQAILERESRGWFLHFREKRAAHLASQKVPLKDIEEEVSRGAMREYVSRVCGAVAASAQLAALGADVPDLLADQLRAYVALTRAEDGVRRKLEAGLATAEARIRASHPILSRADAWRSEKLAIAAQRLRTELRWTAMEDAAAAMQAHKLHQHRYFLLRDLTFLRDREPLLMKELRAAKAPTNEFRFATRIWLARNWAVVRHFRGRAERIPTVISARPTSIVTPRSDPSQPVFLAHRDTLRAASTRWPAWRLLTLAHRAWSWTWNIMFLLGVVVPWCSPLSLRTLLCVKPFVPDLELSQVNGTLFPKRSSETQTMWSRLLQLWRYVSKERTRFETEPDTGLLGKGLSRQAHRVWAYGLVGGLGSLALLLLFPLAALAVSALSLAAALTVPLWAPALALALHVGAALLYELDAPNPGKLNRWFVLFEVLVWRIAILGILQPLLAVVVAVVLCPISALILLKAIGACAQELSRQLGAAARADDWWAARGLEPADWHALAANMLAEVFDAEILVPLEEGEARLPLEAGGAAPVWEARTARDHAPPDVLAERDHWPHPAGPWGMCGEWGGAPLPRVAAPALDAGAFSPRAPHLPPVPHPAAVALVLHNRESDNPVPLESELCAEILRSLEDAPDCDDRRDGVERYRGGGSAATSETSGSTSPDDERARPLAGSPDSALCRISPAGERAACRWTLTGRGVRLRADLASPEDVSLDAERHGTSV